MHAMGAANAAPASTKKAEEMQEKRDINSWLSDENKALFHILRGGVSIPIPMSDANLKLKLRDVADTNRGMLSNLQTLTDVDVTNFHSPVPPGIKNPTFALRSMSQHSPRR
ncbi:unnamed protein product [Sphacelaria rigidula]